MAQNCSDCYNGCSQITSDQCVRYTGVDVPLLGIKNGDSLSYVEQALVTFLSSALDGTGIKPLIPGGDICAFVQSYIPACETLTLNDILTALTQATCALKAITDANTTSIASINSTLGVLNGTYTIGSCLSVSPTAGTHAVVQALNDSLCQFINQVPVTYVKISELDSLIQAYLDSIASTTQYKDRMVPYTVVEYYGPLTNFAADGSGLAGAGFDRIFLCNGNNGTPDKRGRVAVGAIQGVGAGALDPEVDPIAGNPNYALLDKQGENTVTLIASQMPIHTHDASVSDPGHSHLMAYDNSGTSSNVAASPTVPMSKARDTGGLNSDYVLWGSSNPANTLKTSSVSTGVGVTNSNAGNSQPHDNIQPVLACYYIMYIP